MKHTILGAGGAISKALAHELLHHQENVRLVSRTGFSIQGAETFKADLCSLNETIKSIEGNDVAYLTVGLPYSSKIWSEKWPVIMKNTINACKETGVKLIYFDNVYMYGNVKGVMTEKTPYNPCSKKGEVKAKIALMLEAEMKTGNINAVIARSADIYGPYATQTSLPYIMAIENLMKKKKAQWLVSGNKKHSFTYTSDIAKGMILLADNKESNNQIWHLPTYNPALTGKKIIQLVADELHTKPDYQIIKKWMVKMSGLFNKTIREVYEMLYQNENDYIFDSSKFNSFFNYEPKTYKEGIKETIRHLKKNC